MSRRAITAAVETFLRSQGTPFEAAGGVTLCEATFAGRSWPLAFDAREDEKVLLVYSLVPVVARPERRDAVIRFVTRANWGLAVGNFEVDVDDGEIRFRTSLELGGSPLTNATLQRLVTANLVVTAQYLDGLEAVNAGAEPDATVGAIEQWP